MKSMPSRIVEKGGAYQNNGVTTRGALKKKNAI